MDEDLKEFLDENYSDLERSNTETVQPRRDYVYTSHAPDMAQPHLIDSVSQSQLPYPVYGPMMRLQNSQVALAMPPLHYPPSFVYTAPATTFHYDQISPQVESYDYFTQASNRGAQETFNMMSAQFPLLDEVRPLPYVFHPEASYSTTNHTNKRRLTDLRETGNTYQCIEKLPTRDESALVRGTAGVAATEQTENLKSLMNAKQKSRLICPSQWREYDTEDSLCDQLSFQSTHTITCRQPPVQARMCGFGEKDRRPLDPPPVVQCFKLDELGNITDRAPNDPTLTVHVTLCNEECTEDRNLLISEDSCKRRRAKKEEATSSAPRFRPRSQGRTARVLLGSLVASPSVLYDETGLEGTFFIFSDLSIRAEGRYRLRFSLFSMNFQDLMTPGATNQVISHCISDVFTVFSAKRFPGMHKSTELTKALAKQGFKLQIRNEARHQNLHRPSPGRFVDEDVCDNKEHA